MPWKCCVPKCKGNFVGGPKVSRFAFPKDLIIQKKWLNAIGRNDYVPNTSSKVCELHFNDIDIERCTKAYLEDTGQLLEVPLKRPRLVKDAVPSKPGCTPYFSKKQGPQREAPEEKEGHLPVKICRTCLVHNDLYLIDDVNWEGLNLKEVIENWTPLKLKENDKLPRMMCKRCIKDMYQTYHFLLKCKKSEETLQQFVHQDIQNELNKQVLAAKISELEVYENNTYKKNNVTKSDSENVGDNHSDIHYTDDLSDVEDSKELISLVFDESEKEENINTLLRITNIKKEFEQNEVKNKIKKTNDEQTLHDDNLTDLVNRELKSDVLGDSHKEDNVNALFDIANVQTEIKQIEVKNNFMKRRRLKAQLIDKKHLSKSKNISYIFLKGVLI